MDPAVGGQIDHTMESMASSGLFHGFSRSRDYLKAHQADRPVYEYTDGRARIRRKSRKHERFLLRKAFLQQRGLLGIKISEEHSSSTHEDSFLSSPEKEEPSRLEEIKAVFDALPDKAPFTPECSVACDYDSGLSMADSCPSSRASSPVSWQKPEKCVAIDCEMVGTGPGGKISELARCSVVNYEGDVLYDKYIKPELPVTDYRTPWSGITRNHLKKAIPFKVAQKEILNLLKGKRVIGHAIFHDFKVLKYFHPKEQTRDTSNIPLLNKIAGIPGRQSVSLKRLALHILKKQIQVGRKGHSSVEDAQTSMELYKLVEEKVEQHFQKKFHSSDCNNLVKNSATHNQYMDDQYWPSDLNEDCK
ncbi:apoptosis-enhancing nuclease [Leptodactylus fuscus]|uniref:apoptosis-enhancing nuclease n=1 Tax=Leptodactylus fuscus TaxID=238119 RepID=UPI003F4F2402